MLPSSSSSSKLQPTSSYTAVNHDESCHAHPPNANANAVQCASKNKRPRDTNDDDLLSNNDNNKRPRIAVDGTSCTTDEREKICVVLQNLPHKYDIYWLCWNSKIHYTVIENRAGYGQEEESRHYPALVERLANHYSSLTDGYTLLNNDVSTINTFSRQKYYDICDYSIMLDEYDDEVTPNTTEVQTDDTRINTDNNLSNLDAFDGGDYRSSDNNFTDRDNHWGNCCDEEYGKDEEELCTLSAEHSASPRKRSSPTSVTDTSAFTKVEDDDKNTKPNLQQQTHSTQPITITDDNTNDKSCEVSCMPCINEEQSSHIASAECGFTSSSNHSAQLQSLAASMIRTEESRRHVISSQLQSLAASMKRTEESRRHINKMKQEPLTPKQQATLSLAKDLLAKLDRHVMALQQQQYDQQRQYIRQEQPQPQQRGRNYRKWSNVAECVQCKKVLCRDQFSDHQFYKEEDRRCKVCLPTKKRRQCVQCKKVLCRDQFSNHQFYKKEDRRCKVCSQTTPETMRKCGISKARAILPATVSTSTSESFELGTNHHIITGLDFRNLDELQRRDAEEAIRQYIFQSLSSCIGPGTTVSITEIVSQSRGQSQVHYQVVKESVDSTQSKSITPSSITTCNTSEEVIIVAPFVIGQTYKHYPPSLSEKIKDYGTGMLTFLEDLEEVATLINAEVVGDRRKAKGTKWEVVYTKMELQKTQEHDEHYPSPSNVKKHGFTRNAGQREEEYLKIGEHGEMLIRIDGQRLSIEADAGLCELYALFVNAVRDDPLVPPWIKRAICVMLRDRGGERFGAKKKLIFLLLEIAMQLKDGQSVPGECLQWDDNVFIGMIVKLIEALRAIKHLIWGIGKETAALLAWPCAKMREDRVINKTVATEYTGVKRATTPYDGPVNPDAKTHAEAYSSKYTVKRFNNAIDGIVEFVSEAWVLRFIGCLFLLDKNDLACRETGVSLDSILAKYGFKRVGTLYKHPHDIILYQNGKAVIAVHGPLCVGGSIMVEHFTMDDLLLRCLVNDTLRGMVCMANGEEFTGPYLAIEAGMMQKLLVDGLHLNREYGYASVFFREYLTPPEKNCFDLFGKKIQHYLDYPITENNRRNYMSGWSIGSKYRSLLK